MKCLEKAKSTEQSSPSLFYHVSSFAFYVILLFATVMWIMFQREALLLMKKNRVTCHDQK